MNKKVYTIIVTYNGLKWLDNTLQSLANSALKTTVIVIDNHSSDATVPYIRETYPHIILIESPENIGFGRANNIGIDQALTRGADHVLLLNQDAAVHPGTIARLVELQTHQKEYAILSPIHLDGSGKHLDIGFSQYISPPFCPQLLLDLLVNKDHLEPIYRCDFVNAAAWLISKECLDTVGGFDPLFFMYGEDNDYITRVLKHGFKVGVVPGTYINHDRETRNNKVAFSLKKAVNWEWSRCLLGLKDTNQSYFKQWLRTTLKVFKQGIKAFLTFDFKRIWVSIRVFFRIICSLAAIKKSRQKKS